jgi:hypothetical protein
MNKSIDYESLFTYISLILAFAIFIILMYGCLSNNYSKIENFTTTPSQPENAEILSMAVNATGGITSITLKADKKGKYYKDKPPLITIAIPTATGSIQATATVVLNSAVIAETTPELCEIASITIGTAGSNYATTDITKITFETIEAYKIRHPITPAATTATDTPATTVATTATTTAATTTATTAATTTVVDTEPVIAEIANITVNSMGGITSINLNSTAKGKYYKNEPPLITIMSPADTTGKQAKAVAKLKTTTITNTLLYEIDIIDITEAGEKYVVGDSNKISIETIADYKLRTNPIITLTDDQKQNITTLINGCSALNNKQSYVTKITSNNLRKQDVDSIITEVSKSS